jgi:predicted transcriptional regulator
MNVLLSIRPEYAEAIFSGKKRYEFRRTIFKNEDVTEIYLYANSSVQRIVGRFCVGQIISGAPQELWARFKACSGISKEGFFQYFDGCERGYAIEVLDPHSFQPPVNPYLLLDDFKPPQSFYYFSKEQLAVIEVDRKLFTS